MAAYIHTGRHNHDSRALLLRTDASGQRDAGHRRAHPRIRRKRGYFFLRPRLIGMRSVRVVLGLVFARDFFTNRPVIAERTVVVNRCLATTGV